MRNPTTEEIMSQVPEVIEKSEINLKKTANPKSSGMANANGWRSEKDRIRAVTVYAVTGNAAQTAEITGIPSGTIRQWKTQEWWPQIMERIRQEKDDELDVQFTSIVDKTIKQINDRLENGDYIYDNKKGELVRKPMGGKELGVVTSIFVDKRELLRGKKKQQMDQQSIKDKLDEIAKALRLKKPVDIEDAVIINDVEEDNDDEQEQITENTEAEVSEVLTIEENIDVRS